MTMVQTIIKELRPAALIGIAGGVVAILLTMALGILPSDAISQIVISIVMLVVLVMIAAKTGIKNLSLYEAVKLFAGIGIVGSIVNLVVPGVSQFVLASPEFTISGLLMTFIYVGAGMYILKKLKVK